MVYDFQKQNKDDNFHQNSTTITSLLENVSFKTADYVIVYVERAYDIKFD